MPFFLINTGLFSDVKDNSFSRSRSSSVTSIDKESREAISALHFCETFTRKADTSPSPCLWVGTTLGTVLVIVLNLPPGGEQRLLQPVIVSPSGMYKADRLKDTLIKYCCHSSYFLRNCLGFAFQWLINLKYILRWFSW